MIRKIVITLAATIALAAGAAAQNLTVTGSVTDQEGYPLLHSGPLEPFKYKVFQFVIQLKSVEMTVFRES